MYAVDSTTLTDVHGWEHLCTEGAMILGRFTGTYVTLCAETVASASLAAPPGRMCPRCARSTLR